MNEQNLFSYFEQEKNITSQSQFSLYLPNNHFPSLKLRTRRKWLDGKVFSEFLPSSKLTLLLFQESHSQEVHSRTIRGNTLQATILLRSTLSQSCLCPQFLRACIPWIPHTGTGTQGWSAGERYHSRTSCKNTKKNCFLLMNCLWSRQCHMPQESPDPVPTLVPPSICDQWPESVGTDGQLLINALVSKANFRCVSYNALKRNPQSAGLWSCL